MPELPDLVHIEAKLRPALVGRRVVAARVGDPLVLRILVRDPFPAVLTGKTIEEVTRRGHFLCFRFGADLVVVINAMLAGRYFLVATGGKRAPQSTALSLELDGGTELRYVDDKRMGKVYVARREQLGDIPQFRSLGVEILSPAFTLPIFRALMARRRDQVRRFVMDKEALASVGNAYADEILFAARLHPKTFCHKLTPEEGERLFRAIGEVMRNAIAEVSWQDQPVEVKVRDFLAVRGRAGKPCLACGTTIRSVRVGEGDACFCPSCQPASRKLFVDWRKL